MSAQRNPKRTVQELLREQNRRPAKNYGEETTVLQLMGYYPDDPEARSLYEAAASKWGVRAAEQEQARQQHYPGPKLVKDDQPAVFDFAAEAGRQVAETRTALEQDYRQALPYPWPTLHRAIGHGILPRHLVAFAAHSGQGKTTAMFTMLEAWLRAGYRVFGLPLETGYEDARPYLAAVATGHNVKLVLKHAWEQLPSFAKGEIEAHLLWQEESADQLYLHPKGRVLPRELPALYQRAAEWGAQVFFIDHIHRLKYRTWDEYANTVAELVELVKRYSIPCVVTAQMHRGQGPADRLKPFLLPCVDHIQGGKVLEQEAHVVVGLYRPLDPALDSDTMSALRRGTLSVKNYLLPNTVGAAILKSRIEGEIGGVVHLRWHKGRVVDPEEAA